MTARTSLIAPPLFPSGSAALYELKGDLIPEFSICRRTHLFQCSRYSWLALILFDSVGIWRGYRDPLCDGLQGP